MVLASDNFWADMDSRQQSQLKISVSPLNLPIARPSSSRTTPGRSPLSSSSCTNSSRFLRRTNSSAFKFGGRVQKAAEDVLWLASAFFILYYGDFRSNFFSLLASDSRIHSVPLVYGLACIALDAILIIILCVASQLFPSINKVTQDESFVAAASILCTLVGFIAYLMLCMALWPVWHALTIPMLFTLLMAAVVVVGNVYAQVGGGGGRILGGWSNTGISMSGGDNVGDVKVADMHHEMGMNKSR